MARKGIPVLDFDDLITAIQALSAPSATDVAVDPTGMEIITANNSQGALKQLDTAVDSVNSSLTYKTIIIADTSKCDRLIVLESHNKLIITIQSVTNPNLAEGSALFTLPEGHRPIFSQYVMLYSYSQDKMYSFEVGSTGAFKLYGKGNLTSRVIGTIEIPLI